jgi:putative selenate reductase molybdopterin-binding subunit
MLFDENGQPLNASLGKYHIPRAAKMPAMDVIFVQTDEPSGPFGAKSVSEISIDGVAPAMASAIHNATSVWMREVPYTPGRVKSALQTGDHSGSTEPSEQAGRQIEKIE